jgi:serine/threonine protein phosphatase 1
MRHIFVGDVHGMLTELNSLLMTLDLQVDDHIIFVGDLLDKGPDSPGVVRRVMTLAKTHNVVLVTGNHEDTHSRYRAHTQTNLQTASTMALRKPELPQITARLSQDDINFLNQAVLFHRIPTHNLLVVHGGIPKNISRFPNTQREVSTWSSKERKRFKLILRTRYVDATTGYFLGLGDEKPKDPFWAEVYDGRFGHVIFGHQPFLNGVRFFEHTTGIDTGAVFGGTLTALIYEKETTRHTLVSRPSMSVPGQPFAKIDNC